MEATVSHINPLNAELNSIWHLPSLLEAHHIFHVSGLKANCLCRKRSACETRFNTTFDIKISTRIFLNKIFQKFSNYFWNYSTVLVWHTDTERWSTYLHSTKQNDSRRHRLRKESYFNSDTQVESTSLKWRGHISDLMKKCYLTVRSICQRRRKKKNSETLIQATTPYLISHKKNLAYNTAKVSPETD
jgi:hypothetical protein